MTAPGTATLTIADAPELGAGVLRLVLDCPHGTTTIHLVGPAPDEHLAAVARLALARHDAEESCRCTASLRRRYGPAPV